jgi:hypothetical protein
MIHNSKKLNAIISFMVSKINSQLLFLYYLRNKKVSAYFENLPYSQIYTIENTKNLDTHPCFKLPTTYPKFQNELIEFKQLLRKLFAANEGKTIYKFGDGDYFFLKGIPTGSAKPGNRAISKPLTINQLSLYSNSAQKSDLFLCEIYPENRRKFSKVITRNEINYPAEFAYGLLSNKWILKNFSESIGLIGADEKINLISKLMEHKEYRDYLGIEKFTDYIKVPQKFACDSLELRLSELEMQLSKAKSKLFLLGIGHLKSGVLHKLPSYHKAVYLDVGSGIDALAGVIDENRPFFGDWTNYRLKNGFDYNQIDMLQYSRSKIKYLN